MMTRAAWIGVVLGIAVLGAAGWWMYGRETDDLGMAQSDMTAGTATPDADDPVAEPESEPAIAHPMPEPEAGGPALPELENSDAEAMNELRALFGAAPVEALLIPREIVRRIVLAVDSLDREPLPMWLRPVRRTSGVFGVAGEGESLHIDPANASRYDALVKMVDSVDMQKLAAAYRRYYPLFQDAYDRLGNPRARYFNDRVIDIIDHLLATPVVAEPIPLVRPKVLYLFADPELEQRSSGQKAMLRMGRDNAARLQARLREFRSAISQKPPGR
ncbi:MAG: hypothetical protein K0Q76_2357 [Panacagrimonas sp.]|jgi:hypothetical protein|nr:DUF3014 domain-containing protein [Panacagrimonas sp.]MCC2657249.1 hypothetical protein [Panacagrimonas sp.]